MAVQFNSPGYGRSTDQLRSRMSMIDRLNRTKFLTDRHVGYGIMREQRAKNSAVVRQASKKDRNRINKDTSLQPINAAWNGSEGSSPTLSKTNISIPRNEKEKKTTQTRPNMLSHTTLFENPPSHFIRIRSAGLTSLLPPVLPSYSLRSNWASLRFDARNAHMARRTWS